MEGAIAERPRTAEGDQDRLECLSNEPAWLSQGRVPCLNGLRGIAILLVCLFHARLTTGWSAPRAIGELADRGGIGVDFFFAISGFLIT